MNTLAGTRVIATAPALMSRSMRAAKAIAAGALLALLCACAAAPPIPLTSDLNHFPLQQVVTVESGTDAGSTALLVIQRDSAATTRWLLLDPLGIPRARQVLKDGKFVNDGFLPPNRQATELFAATLFALTPAAALNNAYPTMQVTVRTAADGTPLRIMADHGRTRWTVRESPSRPPALCIVGKARTWRLVPVTTPGMPGEKAYACPSE